MRPKNLLSVGRSTMMKRDVSTPTVAHVRGISMSNGDWKEASEGIGCLSFAGAIVLLMWLLWVFHQ